jgi:hypothetical protein
MRHDKVVACSGHWLITMFVGGFILYVGLSSNKVRLISFPHFEVRRTELINNHYRKQTQSCRLASLPSPHHLSAIFNQPHCHFTHICFATGPAQSLQR